MNVFRTKIPAGSIPKWLSIKSHVLGQMGINAADVGTKPRFIELANTLYGLSVPKDGKFEEAIDALFDGINGLSKTARRKLRKQNVSLIEYNVRPHSAAVKRAAIKAGKKRSEKKQVALNTYRKKHLVLASKDGELVFDNVKQGSAKEERELFYASWEWRTLRMEIIKKQGKRCNCCGATPQDLTVGGSHVRLVVDHIKPLSKYWQLRLAPSNLQILCDECNMGKGAWDETDHRSESQKLIEEQLRYEVV